MFLMVKCLILALLVLVCVCCKINLCYAQERKDRGVKIYKPGAELKDEFLIRAIIDIPKDDMCEIVHTLPSFFKQLNL